MAAAGSQRQIEAAPVINVGAGTDTRRKSEHSRFMTRLTKMLVVLKLERLSRTAPKLAGACVH